MQSPEGEVGSSVSPEGPYLEFWGNNTDRIKTHFEGSLGRTNLLSCWARIQNETKQSKKIVLAELRNSGRSIFRTKKKWIYEVGLTI